MARPLSVKIAAHSLKSQEPLTVNVVDRCRLISRLDLPAARAKAVSRLQQLGQTAE